ncbi:MAG: Uma2 family endonuclease [Chloroflexota bacterium]|nr:Uma2 family endonuclease [Chloroflexota bacterium]
MSQTIDRRMTAEQFDDYVLLPENSDRRLEWHDGEIIELVSNGKSSRTAFHLGNKLGIYVYAHRSGVLTGADGGYWVNGEKYIPDAAYLSYARQPIPASVAYNPLAPDLAIEVISPTDKPLTIARKIQNYMAAGTVVWLVDPQDRVLNVHRPGKKIITLTADDTLDGGDLLPGFTAPLADIFE